jgi:hypothetical protein
MVLLVCFCIFFIPASASAKKYTENGMTYQIADEEATLVKCEVEGDDITIPSMVNGYKVTGIGSNAFMNSRYSSIVLPDTVIYIYSSAFQGCENLKKITLPDKLELFGGYAFSGCVKLKEARLARNITEIPAGTFDQCINLKSIIIPSKVTLIGECAFRKCYKLKNIKLGNKVKKIEEKAFSRNYMMKNITIPASVTNIGSEAFYKCKRLKKVVFAGDKTGLGENVFKSCKELKKINLPKNMKYIPEGLLADTGIASIKIPEKVSIIKADAFADCEKLTKIKLNKKMYAIGDSVFENSGLKSISLNADMRYIGNGAFRGTKLKSISLPGKVTYIGNRVFANCRSLTSINIPAGVKGINPGAFNNCVSLKSIAVAAANKEYSSQDGVLYNKNKTKLIQYPLNKKNASFTVPRSVDTIRSHAFEENSHLISVTLSTKNIGKFAFASMENLKTVNMQNGVNNIGEQAFGSDLKLTSVTIPESVKVIGYRAFRESMIKTAHIPSSLQKFDSNAFEECYKLESFTGGRGRKYRVSDGVLYDARMSKLILYPAKKADKTFTVPASVKYLGSDAFVHVSGLKELSIGKNIKSLAYSCIRSCESLRSITFAEGANPENGYGTIEECSRLAVIVAPDRYVFRSMAQNAGATLITL